MGVINKTTEKINELLDKIEDAPDKIENGKTPVFVAGTTTTLDPGMSATAEVVLVGTDPDGNPQYKINIGVPKGHDGTGGGGGGVADSVQWTNVLNKPGWVNSATKPTYTASEVGALPEGTKIPTKTSDIENDSGFLTSGGLKTINGESIVGEGNISLSGSGGISDAPKDGKTYGRNNGSWVETSQMDEAPSDGNAYARKNKGWASVLESTESALLGNYLKPDAYTAIEPTDSINTAIGKLEAGINSGGSSEDNNYYLDSALLTINELSTEDDILEAVGGSEGVSNLISAIKNNRNIYIKGSILSSLDAYKIPVSVGEFLSASVMFSFIYRDSNATTRVFSYHIAPSGVKKVEISYPLKYRLDINVFMLNSSSSSDDIGSAIGGERGLRKAIIAAQNGNDLVVKGQFSTYNILQGVSVSICNIAENGDMSLALHAISNSYIWGKNNPGAVSLVIMYTKSSNTFSIGIE